MWRRQLRNITALIAAMANAITVKPMPIVARTVIAATDDATQKKLIYHAPKIAPINAKKPVNKQMV